MVSASEECRICGKRFFPSFSNQFICSDCLPEYIESKTTNTDGDEYYTTSKGRIIKPNKNIKK